MSRAGGRNGRRLPPGAELSWEHAPGEPADTAPTPLFPNYDVPKADKLQPREQREVDRYRALRERFHDGPYHAIVNEASTSAKKDSKLRAQFDPFHGMPSYTEKYRKRKRTIPHLAGREYVMNFFPRELWPVIQPNFKPDSAAYGGAAVRFTGTSHGFEEDDEDEADEGSSSKRQKGENDDDGEPEDRKGGDDGDVDEDEDEDGEIQDDDFSEDDDEMGGDYNAEQYFDGGDEDGDGDGFGDGGGGGDEDAY